MFVIIISYIGFIVQQNRSTQRYLFHKSRKLTKYVFSMNEIASLQIKNGTKRPPCLNYAERV